MCPTPIDKLDMNSHMGQINAAISECIAMEMDGGMEQSQAIAACHEMARKKTGKELAKKGGS